MTPFVALGILGYWFLVALIAALIVVASRADRVLDDFLAAEENRRFDDDFKMGLLLSMDDYRVPHERRHS